MKPSGPFNDTEPTSSLFTFGGRSGGSIMHHSYLTNGPSGDKFIPTSGTMFPDCSDLVHMLEMDGNGSYINCGFKPAMVWLKAIGGTGNWVILDNKRPGYNSEQKTLITNGNAGHNASGGTTNDLLSNGFKIRGT